MIILNPIIKLDYNPVTDVLMVDWPDMQEYSVSQAAYTLDIIVEAVRLYDVKHLLIDTRSGILNIPEEVYKHLLLNFFNGLSLTRFQKLSRVVSKNSVGEDVFREARLDAQLTVFIRNFETIEEALMWHNSPF